MDNRKAKIWTWVLILIIALALSACGARSIGGGGGSGSGNLAKDSGDGWASAPAPAPAPAAAPSMAYDEAEWAMEDAGYTSTTAGGVQSGRKLTFRADMSINTKNFDADYKAINDMITEAGGYVASENMYDNAYYAGRNGGRNSYISARIPAEGYDSFLDSLATVGDVVSKNKSSDDLTSEYFDTEARIEMLEIRKERLMDYLVKAEEAADIVEFERELSNVLYELDSYQGNKRRLDRLVEFATIDVNLNEVITPETIGKDGEPLGERASDAFAFSLGGVGRFLQGAVVFLAGAVPVIILLAVIAVIIWLIVRLVRRLREKISGVGWREAKQSRRDEKYQRNLARIQEKQYRKAARRGAPPPMYQQPPGGPAGQQYQQPPGAQAGQQYPPPPEPPAPPEPQEPPEPPKKK